MSKDSKDKDSKDKESKDKESKDKHSKDKESHAKEDKAADEKEDSGKAANEDKNFVPHDLLDADDVCPKFDVPKDRKSWYTKSGKLKRDVYEKHLFRLQRELVAMQEWIKEAGLKVVVLFEGRDAAGKGGTIKRIIAPLNPRVVRIAALPKPTEREMTQWYFQRYVAELPAAGEMVLFDRSWYNRAGVERVMGFCTRDEYLEFAREVPEFERMLIRSGTILIKYWFSVSDEEQERRFQSRLRDPMKRWKLSPMDLESRRLYREYSRAKDDMLKFSDTRQSPWWIVPSDDKKRARLNCIHHLLSSVAYKDVMPDPLELPPRDTSKSYVRIPMEDQTFVPIFF